MRSHVFILRFMCLVLMISPPLRCAVAQVEHAQPVFDVISIHPMQPGDTTPEHITNSPHNGSFQAVNVPVKSLMEVAFDLPDTRMYGGPSWLTTDRFSVEAKADPKLDQELASLPSDQGKEMKRAMLKALLTNWFKLAVHTDMRDMPVYALVAAKDSAKRDPAAANSAAAGTDHITVRAGHNSLEILAYELSWRLGRPVLDQTGRTWSQALVLTWRDDTETASDSDAPSLRTALQEQLGLRLEPTHASVPALSIDHAEKPSEEN
ncbi:MAG TPA: TIGR03435 family protein [Terriglobus sp.]